MCLFINGLVPRYSIPARGYDVLSRVMGAHAPLLELFSLSAIPIKIVGQLMKDAAGAPVEKERGQNREGTSAGASTDFSTVTAEARAGTSREVVDTPGGSTALSLQNGIVRHEHMNSTLLGTDEGPPGGIGWIILLLLFLLPRSGIDDNALMGAVRYFFARFAPANRVFYCRGGAQ